MNIFQKINELISSGKGAETLDTTQLDIISLCQLQGFNITNIKPSNFTLCGNSGFQVPYIVSSAIIGTPEFIGYNNKGLYYGDLDIYLSSDGAGSNDEVEIFAYTNNFSASHLVFNKTAENSSTKVTNFKFKNIFFESVVLTNAVGASCFFSGYKITAQ